MRLRTAAASLTRGSIRRFGCSVTLPIFLSACQPLEILTPRNRPSEAAICCSSIGSTALPSVRSTLPNMTSQALARPNVPLALIAACPRTNSVSPNERSAFGPSFRYIEWHSAKTVATMLCPLSRSAASSGIK